MRLKSGYSRIKSLRRRNVANLSFRYSGPVSPYVIDDKNVPSSVVCVSTLHHNLSGLSDARNVITV